MAAMAEGAYARAGVDQSASGSAVSALVEVLAGIDTGRERRSALGSGHYAAVLRLDDSRGLALACDGVGTKVIVAERLGRFDTVGIDCIAMNVNDVICVGADPIAVLDYIAVERADPAALEQIAIGLRRGAEEAGVEIPGGELAVLEDLDEGLDGRTVGDLLLEPTAIYVQAVRELLASEVDVRGLAHITGDGLLNLLRLEADVGYRIDSPLPVPLVFELIAERGGVEPTELYEVFNMGCGFCCVMPVADAEAAVELLSARHPGAAGIGRTTTATGVVELPSQGLRGTQRGFERA